MWVYTSKVVRMMNESINPSPQAVKQQNFKILSGSFFLSQGHLPFAPQTKHWDSPVFSNISISLPMFILLC